LSLNRGDKTPVARLSLYDWFTVTRAGENEPVAKIVRGFVADEGGKQAASVAGLDKMVPTRRHPC
jgi:hypothetical protein